MTKEIRELVYKKFNGHCAYCGKKIEFKNIQVDHLIPKATWEKHDIEEIECFENYMPSCRRCNHYKRANSLEGFREMIETIPSKLFRDNYIFKVACDYDFFQ